MTEHKDLMHFARQNYLNLETFRKTGEGVKAPVWFVEVDGKLYVRTLAQSAKVKRLRRNAQVRVAPCEVNGNLKGEWGAAVARVVAEPATRQRVNDLMNRKYGLMKRLFDLPGMFSRQEMATIEITLG